MRPSRGATTALLLATTALTAGCGPSSEALRAEAEVASLRRDVAERDARIAELSAELERTRADSTALTGRLGELETRLRAVERRTGLAPFEPRRLERPADGPVVLSLREASMVPRAGDRPQRRNLRRHLASYRGVVFVFWATWCVPCIADEELVAVAALRKQLRARNVELISMAIDDLAKVRAHAKARRWVYPLWQLDDGHIEMLPREFIEKVGLGLPLFLLADRDGRVRYYYRKALDPEASREIVDAAVRGF